jgi:hypothetical protein
MDGRQINLTERSGSSSSWLNILLGIWVIISPFVLAFPSPKAMWSNVATGIVVGILAIVRSSVRNQPGWSWINVILGIWLILSPFVFGVVSGAALWNNVILGIIIAAIALSNAPAKASARV